MFNKCIDACCVPAEYRVFKADPHRPGPAGADKETDHWGHWVLGWGAL